MSKKILVVDDEPQMLSMLKVRLEGNNYQVITANGGVEGVEAAKTERPSVRPPCLKSSTSLREVSE